ncbi:MAG: TniQ family protein [Thiogranum sp.]|nr:TniQ family protein [Thiogranum sp.]
MAGYVVRLANNNGWHSARRWLCAYDVPANWKLDIHEEKLVYQLARITGHDAQLIVAYCFSDELAPLKPDETRSIQILTLPYIQLCPACFSQRPYHRASWQYLPITHCLNHGQPLLRRCPVCKCEFSLDSLASKSGCPNCGTTWPRLVAKNSALPRYLHHFASVTSDLNAQTRFVNDLMSAAQRAIRPLDGILDHAKRPNSSIADWTEVLDRAYRILNEPLSTQQWASACNHGRSKYRALGRQTVFRPIYSLLEKLVGRWPIHEVCLADNQCVETEYRFRSYGLSERPPRTRLLKSDKADEKLGGQETWDGLVRTIGCESNDIERLAFHNVIETTNRTRPSVKSIFDTADLLTKLVGISGPREMDYIPLKDAKVLIPLFGTTLGDTLAAILRGDLPMHLGDNHEVLVDGIWLSRFRLLMHLNRQLRARPFCTLSHRQTSQALCISECRFQQLARLGLLVPHPWQRNSDWFEVQTILTFLERHWIPARWARLKRIRQKTVKRFVRSLGCFTTVAPGVYQRTPELMSALRRFQIRMSTSCAQP